MDDLPSDDLPGRETPAGVSDQAVVALGQLTEALETCERARGHLYAFHQLTGSADIKLGAAVESLREAGHAELADRIQAELVGRNVLPGRWTSKSSKSTTTATGRCFERSNGRHATSSPAARGTSTKPG